MPFPKQVKVKSDSRFCASCFALAIPVCQLVSTEDPGRGRDKNMEVKQAFDTGCETPQGMLYPVLVHLSLNLNSIFDSSFLLMCILGSAQLFGFLTSVWETQIKF